MPKCKHKWEWIGNECGKNVYLCLKCDVRGEEQISIRVRTDTIT